MEVDFLFLLILKHAIADVGIQRHLGIQKKHEWLSKKAQLHYLTHGIGTFIVLSPIDLIVALIAGIVDWIAHWHIDFIKTNINNKYNTIVAKFQKSKCHNIKDLKLQHSEFSIFKISQIRNAIFNVKK